MTLQVARFDIASQARSLSPSRAADFKACPLLYRFRTIDRLPQRPSAPAARGTLVHAVLERLFALPAPRRTVDEAKALVPLEWERLLEAEPELTQVMAELRNPDDGSGATTGTTACVGAAEPAGQDTDRDLISGWLVTASGLVDSYFALEDPTRVQPVGRELMVEFDLGDGPVLRGIIDRLDATADGVLRVVDYKTGVAPREAYEASALFQMKFYALLIYRTRGVVPGQLRLLYLGDRDMLSYAPDAEELDRFEQILRALWAAIARSVAQRDFRPNPSRRCTWCDYQPLCPAWGGTPPPYPDAAEPVDDPAEPD